MLKQKSVTTLKEVDELFQNYQMQYQNTSDEEKMIYQYIYQDKLMFLQQNIEKLQQQMDSYDEYDKQTKLLRMFIPEIKLYDWNMKLAFMDLCLSKEQMKGIIHFIETPIDTHYAIMQLQMKRKELFDKNRQQFIRIKHQLEIEHNFHNLYIPEHIYHKTRKSYQQAQAVNHVLIKKI